MVHISDLPVELLLDSLLPCLALRDLLALASTSRFFAVVCGDDTFWKRKTSQEYNFSGAATARTTGFRNVYRGLRSPRVFVWGDAGNSRLALERRKHHSEDKFTRGIDYPVELDIHARVVHLAAAGWSFHALTDDGRVIVWGQLDSQGLGWGSENLAHTAATVKEPLGLLLPQRIKSLCAGRRHAVLLDAHQDIWIVLAWGLPARLVAPVFDATRPDSTLVQVEAGWDVCAFLTQTGTAFVVFPFHGDLAAQVEAHARDQVHVPRQGDHIPCQCWDIQHHPTQLPPLPADLPVLHPNAFDDAPPKLVKIAAGDMFVVGLTDGGHVLKLDLPTQDESQLARLISRGDLCWNYLPKFCDVAHVGSEPGFRPHEQQSQSQSAHTALQDLTVTHISAQFETFVVYSTVGSSVVLLGGKSTTNDTPPKVIPELQHRNVISVVLGDYHYCALTSNGELFSWGKHSNGALGLGSPSAHGHGPTQRFRFMAPHPPPRDTDTPTRISFHHEDNFRDRYVFAVAAAGWHCGALVIDLHSTSHGNSNPRQEAPQLKLKREQECERELERDGPATNHGDAEAPTGEPIARTEAEHASQRIPQITLPIVRGGGAPFRIGYAARGAFAGHDGAGRGSTGSNSGSGAHPGRAEQ